jgi:hypothetical protein
METLAKRQARYERIMAMLRVEPKPTLEEIGARLDPPLTRERVRQIVRDGLPKRAGRPSGVNRRDALTRRLQFWENRLASARTVHDRTTARERVATISGDLAALSDNEAGVGAQ